MGKKKKREEPIIVEGNTTQVIEGGVGSTFKLDVHGLIK